MVAFASASCDEFDSLLEKASRPRGSWQCNGLWVGIQPRADTSDGYRVLSPAPVGEPLLKLTLVSRAVYEVRMPKGTEVWRTRPSPAPDEFYSMADSDRVWLLPTSSEVECLGESDAAEIALTTWLPPDDVDSAVDKYSGPLRDAARSQDGVKRVDLEKQLSAQYHLSNPRARALAMVLMRFTISSSNEEQDVPSETPSPGEENRAPKSSGGLGP